jgi:hypothetical protein
MAAGLVAAQERSPGLPPMPPPPLIAPDSTSREPSGSPPRLMRVAQPQPVDEFEPISEVPPEDRMPAAPMVVAAYVFALLAFFIYVFSLVRRLAAVKADIGRLESELKRAGRT